MYYNVTGKRNEDIGYCLIENDSGVTFEANITEVTKMKDILCVNVYRLALGRDRCTNSKLTAENDFHEN